MSKHLDYLKKLEYFCAKADQLILMKQEYFKQAKEFDEEFNKWQESEASLERSEIHPCHIIKKLLENTSPIIAP